ncbi:MAG TPA: methyl-accepting chemotaxis protein [Candidatus Sulfotelmatobacter sp.]|nr:methyl-accepting chemotaxis protein [Candidatus Sulfotelmatobacter sp.]HXP45979.1 methyl-accepting chemotaxis protein [Terriglobales bacterium]
MTIGKKLYWSFGFILGMVLLLFFVNWVAARRAAASLELAGTTNAVRSQMMLNRLYLGNYLLSGDTREVERMNEGLRILNEKLEQGKALAASDQTKSAFNKVQQLEQSWSHEFAQALIDKRKDVDAGNATVAELQIFYLQKDASTWVKNSTDALDAADEENHKPGAEHNKSDESTANWTITISAIGTLIAFIAGALIAYRTAKSITQPLGNLMNVARTIGNTGDLEHNIDASRQDELGELARSFARMVVYLKEMAGVSESIAGGDLTVEVKPRSSHDTLGNAFARMVDGLAGLVRSVRDASSQVASASNQVAGASDDSAKIGLQASSAIDEVTSTMHEMSVNVQNMVKSTQVQASSVSETSASIDQMVASIQRVADTAKVLLDISNRSREEVHNGINTMEKATDGLTRINTTINSSGEIIGALGQRADDIGKIIEVIDDLAEQTNLLALNAAIEAARAGEHGLGFAVVADEVRKLAEKSAQSTKEISELIQSIQKEARKAVENMDRSTSIVNEGLELGGELNAALRKISNVVTEVYKFAQEIGAATNEQSHGSSQIARATTRLNEITHEINSAVEEQASGAQAVVKAMERMRELVQQSTSGSTELAASSEQMSKMSRGLLEFMDRFALAETSRPSPGGDASRTRRAAAGAQG